MKNQFALFFLLSANLLFSNDVCAQLQPIQVSPDHRYLVTADGKPFFWLADTAWELFHRTTKAEACFRLQTLIFAKIKWE